MNASNPFTTKPRAPIGSTSSMPVLSPGLVASLGLRPSAITEPSEVECAWRANGSQTATRDAGAILQALVKFWGDKRPSLEHSRVREFVWARHPMLTGKGQRGAGGMRGATNERQHGRIHPLSGTTPEQRLGANEAGAILAVGPTMKGAFH